MAKRNRNRRKDDDETLVDIGQVSTQAGSWFEENQNIILGAIGGLLLIIGGYMAYKFLYQEPRNEQASLALYEAQQQFEKDSFALALTNPAPNASGFLDIADSYGGTKAGNLAHYYAGISYLNLGQFQDAIDYLEDFSPEGDITPIMKDGALGDAYSELGDYDEALSYYEDAASYENNFLTPYYMFKRAMLLNKQGDSQQSLEILKKIKKDYPNSSTASDIDKYIARMESE